MQELLNNPAIQAAAAPLVAGFVLAIVLRRFGVIWQGLAIMAGLLITVMLTIGLNFQPLTSTRKIILCSLFLPFLTLMIDRLPLGTGRRRFVVQVLGAGLAVALAAMWVAWPALARQEDLGQWLMGGRVALYGAAIGGAFVWLGDSRKAADRAFIYQGAALLALALGTGGGALIAASALYGQLAFAIAAATGGLLLSRLILPPQGDPNGGLGQLCLLAAAVPLGLLGASATVYAKLPPLALLCLVMIPVFVHFLTKPLALKFSNRWLHLTVITLLAIIPVIPALWLAWRVAGPVSF